MDPRGKGRVNLLPLAFIYKNNFSITFLPLQQDYHPKIEIISEVANDSNSALEENNKSMIENSVEEVPTAIFSNVCQNHKEHEKEHLRPLLKSLFTEPDNSEGYLESKDKEVAPLKHLIQEVITEPKDHLLLSPVCHQPDDPSSWEENGKITVTLLITEKTGFGTDTLRICSAPVEGCYLQSPLPFIYVGILIN